MGSDQDALGFIPLRREMTPLLCDPVPWSLGKSFYFSTATAVKSLSPFSGSRVLQGVPKPPLLMDEPALAPQPLLLGLQSH